jgi:hypothetical protein
MKQLIAQAPPRLKVDLSIVALVMYSLKMEKVRLKMQKKDKLESTLNSTRSRDKSFLSLKKDSRRIT